MSALLLYECDRDVAGVAIPRPEIQLVVRFGASTHGGPDVHALGARLEVRRKPLRSGQRTVTARLHLGATEAVLGAPASALSGRIVALEELWGSAETRRLLDRLAEAHDTDRAATVLDGAIARRLGAADVGRVHPRLALDAARRLSRDSVANVNDVAVALGVSERHLRRVFRDTVGMGPKEYARLARFRRALRAAREGHEGWSSIAAEVGYYDQAHLIAEFRAIAGVTPNALLSELGAGDRAGSRRAR
jgi:AraC-like DNA-binding protein